MGILIVFIPLLIYLIAALSVKKDEIKHPDDYFAAFKKVGKTEFTSSSIAYGFQVSTIYPFLFWGASMFLFVPFVNAVFWGIGILLFYFSFNKISRFLGSGKTLHGLIGETYGQKARVTASLLTIVGFIGYIIAELWFGTRVLLSVFPSNNWLYVSVFIFIFFIALYLFKAGQISSIRTDQLQLIFTYFGVFGIIIYLLYLIIKNGTFIGGELSWGLLILSVLIPIILLIRKAKFILLNSFFDKILNILITIFFILIFVFSILIVIMNSQNYNLHNFVNLEGFGFTGLFSLMLLPLCWQFVDLTNWQRLLSVKMPESTSQINQDIKKGLLNFSIESPFTWILFIVFGLLISASLPNWSFEDILIDFPKQMIHSSIIFEQILGYTFIVSIISIMLSTIDSFFMGISFTYTYDINPHSRRLIKEKSEIDLATTNQILNKGKYFGFFAVIVAFSLFIFFDQNIESGGELFINLLLTFYSAILSLFPLIFAFIFLKTLPNEIFAILSMLIGSISGISLGVYSVLFNPEYAWYPIIVCLILSHSIFFCGYLIKKLKV
ncbi:hypothetical protein ACFL6H_04445 [Candidatus Latescibacterota bacterium]